MNQMSACGHVRDLLVPYTAGYLHLSIGTDVSKSIEDVGDLVRGKLLWLKVGPVNAPEMVRSLADQPAMQDLVLRTNQFVK